MCQADPVDCAALAGAVAGRQAAVRVRPATCPAVRLRHSTRVEYRPGVVLWRPPTGTVGDGAVSRPPAWYAQPHVPRVGSGGSENARSKLQKRKAPAQRPGTPVKLSRTDSGASAPTSPAATRPLKISRTDSGSASPAAARRSTSRPATPELARADSGFAAAVRAPVSPPPAARPAPAPPLPVEVDPTPPPDDREEDQDDIDLICSQPVAGPRQGVVTPKKQPDGSDRSGGSFQDAIDCDSPEGFKTPQRKAKPVSPPPAPFPQVKRAGGGAAPAAKRRRGRPNTLDNYFTR